MAATATISGARAIFTIDQQPMAYGQGVDGGEEISYEPVEVLDHLEVKEWVPTGYRVNLSCRLFRTMGSGTGQGSLKKRNLMPKNQGNPNEILLANSMDVLIADRITQDWISKFEGVKLSSHSFSITARGIVSTDVNFVCIRHKDESQQP